MKNTLTILILIILAMAGVIAIGFTELYKQTELDRKEIEGLRKENEAERDSLELVLKSTRDSLEVAFTTIRNAKAETEKAKTVSDREIKKLKGILFVRYESDSARMKALKTLYPSWNY